MSERVKNILASLPMTECGCKIWTGKPRHEGGYATAWINGKEKRLNRYVLENKLGRKLLPNMLALHECDNRMCVADGHLYEGTHEQNMKDMRERGRAATGDRNGARLYPERWQRGNGHYSRRTPEKLARGATHGMSQLDDEKVRKIRQMYSSGAIQREIGELFGIGQTTVSSIVRRSVWKHVK